MTAAHVIQRPLRGSRISTFYPVKSLPSLSSLDSAFQLQEYISLLIRLDVHDVDSIVSLPGTSKKDSDAAREKQGTEGSSDDDKDGDKKSEIQVDQACWIYEQLRRLAQDLSHPLITTLQQECTRATCPEMKAGEWLYLCVAHGNDGAMEQCCAIDYILHTVDSATALLNSPRTFPSRLQIPQTSHRHFSALARRLGRIFAHAYFSHREVFEQAEAESSLYARFLALTSTFDLVPLEFLVIPSNQDGRNDRERDPARDAQQYTAESSGRATLAPKLQTQQDVGISRSKSPIAPQDTPSTDNGTGEDPPAPSNPRPRFGRNRTDTMVFADIEASGVADELAAKARAGEFDMGYETETPNTAKPEGQLVPNPVPEEPEDLDLESEAQFEILLDPEEVISSPSEAEIVQGGVIEVEPQEKSEETVIPTGDSFNIIDSATMDEHIQATLSEEEEEEEEEADIAEGLDVDSQPPQGPEPEENDTKTTEDVTDQTVAEPTALPQNTVVAEAADTTPSTTSHEPSESAHLETTKEPEGPSPEHEPVESHDEWPSDSSIPPPYSLVRIPEVPKVPAT